MIDPMFEIIGLLAAFLTTSAFIPQVYKIYKEKKADGISLTMYVILFIGVLLWLLYGILIGSLSIIIANGIERVVFDTNINEIKNEELISAQRSLVN